MKPRHGFPDTGLVLFVGNPGALVDLAADLSWLTGRELAEFVLDSHLFVLDSHLVAAEDRDELIRTTWVNQAIGVLIGRGYTPEHAAHQIDLLPTRTEQERCTSAAHVHTGLRAAGRRPT